MRLLGIEIGGSKLQLCVGTEDGTVLARRAAVVDRAAGGGGIRVQLRPLLEELQWEHRCEAVGVGYGGPVDWETGRIHKSHHVAGWDGFPLGEWLSELTGLPTAVENDTNAGAFAEARRGAGAGANPVFYTNSGSGVGGGLVVGGSIYHGAKPGETEIGHLRLDRSGRIVEDNCSGWSVDQKIRAEVAAAPGSTLARLAADAGTTDARLLAPALARGCTVARRILDATAEDLAFALSHVVQLLHPEVIVLGGGLSKIGEPWREAIAGALPRFTMRAFQPGPRVLLAAHGEDVVPVGALLLAAALAQRLA